MRTARRSWTLVRAMAVAVSVAGCAAPWMLAQRASSHAQEYERASGSPTGQTSASNVPAPQPRGSLQVHVDLVNVPVTVIGASGDAVRGLRAQDFTLTEDGRPETIRLFQQDASRPLAIVLAMDTSLSVHKDLALEKQAADQFVHSLLRPADRVELLAFAGSVTERVPFTSDLRQIDRGLARLHGVGPTALYGAIERAADNLRPMPGRRVILVVSDGDNSMPGVNYGRALAAALRARASIESIIIVPIAASAGRDLAGEHALIQLSQDTGGQYFYVEDPARLDQAFAQVSRSLRNEYLLGYYPADRPAAGAFHSIHLQMANPALNGEYQLHYRAGYYADPRP